VSSLESWLFRGAAAVLALHFVDEALIDRAEGTSRGDHLSVLVLAAAIVGLAVAYPSFPAALRALLGFVFVPLAAVNAAMHVMDARWNGVGGADFTGFLLIPAAGAFVVAAILAVLSRPPARSWPRRIVRWALTAILSLVMIFFVSIPISVGVAQTRKPGQTIPDSAFSTPHETVTLHTRDGLDLAGWYVPSKNRAAIVVVHGGGGDRRGSRRHAAMLARHGYGVLLYDARGRGESQGSPNAAGWTWQADVDAALEFLSKRHEVDPDRIGGLGLSTGADVLLEAAAKDPRLKAVVLDGTTARSLGDVRHLSWSDQLTGIPYWAVAYGTIAVLDQSLPGEPLIDLARKIAPKPALFIASIELFEPVLGPKYAAAYGDPGALWRVDAGHTKGLAEHPKEYEQRVTAFFDEALR
jgi:fermentation-respiration switch protein FrsA (DUF1100 family)